MYYVYLYVVRYRLQIVLTRWGLQWRPYGCASELGHYELGAKHVPSPYMNICLLISTGPKLFKKNWTKYNIFVTKCVFKYRLQGVGDFILHSMKMTFFINNTYQKYTCGSGLAVFCCVGSPHLFYSNSTSVKKNVPVPAGHSRGIRITWATPNRWYNRNKPTHSKTVRLYYEITRENMHTGPEITPITHIAKTIGLASIR